MLNLILDLHSITSPLKFLYSHGFALVIMAQLKYIYKKFSKTIKLKY